MTKVQIVSGPVSMRTLALLGVIVFAIGFWHGTNIRNAETLVVETSTPAPQAGHIGLDSQTTATTAVRPGQSSALPAVTIRLMKFAPETVEVQAGDIVEWANKDLTPHTVTSPKPGERELDSSSINAGTSWQHRFERQGTFPYACTFHPEMKGVVVVR